MAENTHAGAGAVQPLPSRKGGLGGESRPLQSFIAAIPAMRVAMQACGVPAFSFSPLNLLPKIALGKLTVQESPFGNIRLQSPDGTLRIVPCRAQGDYWSDVLDAVGAKTPLALLPEWAANALRPHTPVKKQHDEFMMATDTVLAMAGGSLKSLRKRIKHCAVETITVAYDPAQEAEFLALNAVWYRQNSERKFRTYDKTSIDWMIRHWPDIAAADHTARLLGIRHKGSGQLLSLNAGCLLTASIWTAYTRRFDRDATVQGAGPLGHYRLAEGFADIPTENNGTADTKDIRDNKLRLSSATLKMFTAG